MNSLIVTPYRPDDEHEIIKLFKLVYGRDMSMNYWRWRFVDNPAGRHMIDLCWDGPILAGHYAVSPVIMSIRGKEYLTALSMTTMTHPDYRNKGIFTALAQSLYRRLQDQGVVMVWGFPNNNSYHGFMNKLSWFPLTQVPKLATSDFRFPNMVAGHRNTEIIEVKKIDERFDQLWQSLDRSGVNMVVRSSKYLQWRYMDNPVNQYQVFALPGFDKIKGYTAVKLYSRNDGISGEILDLLATDKDTARSLISHAVINLAIQGADRINLWMNPAARHYEVIKEFGFGSTKELTHLGAMSNDPQIVPELISDYDRWYVTMGDSDVY
ncbi:MAG: GNAT family N-acetyltransferase [Desulfotomaculaceae bacterium]|nr:GNAT family N-acetyltransferase [Desulfotomaculaceae bacterium]